MAGFIRPDPEKWTDPKPQTAYLDPERGHLQTMNNGSRVQSLYTTWKNNIWK